MVKIFAAFFYTCLINLLLTGSVDAQQTPKFWYEDNNMNTAGGYPPDYAEMFRHPEKWSSLRSKLSVYLIRGNTLNNIIKEFGEAFVTDTMVPVLKNANLKLAIDNPQNNYEYIYNLMKNNGLTISHVGLQSTLSKPRGDVTPQYDPELQNRIDEVKNTISSYHQFAPDVKYGIIDARPTKGWEYKNAYLRLKNAMAATDHPLDFIILDCPYSYPSSGKTITWQGLKTVEKYVAEEMGIEYGLVLTDNIGGMASDSEYYNSVINYARDYIKSGTQPHYFVQMSWFHHPSLALPENAAAGSFPMTKIGLELFSYLENEYQPASKPVIETEKSFQYRIVNKQIQFKENLNDYEIYNLSGKTIKHSSNLSNNIIDIDKLTPGIYLIRISTSKGSNSFKFIKH